MKLCFNISWAHPRTKENEDGSLFYVNLFSPDADFVVDFGCPFSILSAKYIPEKRIFAASEPSPYMFFTNEMIKMMGDFYKGAILSWHRELAHFPQTRKFGFGSSQVCWEELDGEKKFGVGGIFSAKDHPAFHGYRVRRNILDLDGKIKIPSMIYSPRNTWNGVNFKYPIETKKESLDYMFHLAIENCSEPGYFTEKIIDCFVCRSIPVYYGDPNIGEIFDMNGIIVLDRSNILGQLNSLTQEMYFSKMASIEENKRRAKPYTGFESNVYYHIKRYFG